jgi:hypothetical protein
VIFISYIYSIQEIREKSKFPQRKYFGEVISKNFMEQVEKNTSWNRFKKILHGTKFPGPHPVRF